ncbi:MAG: hypothetical protein PHH60_05010 [Candidatus Margulisbacteria bacterium]|nr:hypothetical protein [Candidatus Margulisiibacteriota bacterium]
MLFSNSPDKFLRRRQPIDERARLAAQERSISYQLAQQLCTESVFFHGPSRFALFNSLPAAENRLAALVVSHLGSIFQNKHIAIVMKPDEKGFPSISVFATDTWIALPDQAEDATSFNSRFLLEFKVHASWGDLHLEELRSKDGGLGGKALAALYNICRELGLPKITFSVDPCNSNGRQFYYHIDFGRPKQYAAYQWEVDHITAG